MKINFINKFRNYNKLERELQKEITQLIKSEDYRGAVRVVENSQGKKAKKYWKQITDAIPDEVYHSMMSEIEEAFAEVFPEYELNKISYPLGC